jgi:short subunit dehydrogenase-like uncharacterized protein
MSSDVIAVYGATGYTGKQVLAELRQHGLALVLVGRDRSRLEAAAESDEVRIAALDDPGALHRGLQGASAVINCAGPFEPSAKRVASAAIANGAHYLDFTAEQAPVNALFDGLDGTAKEAGVAVLPAAGFYGGLGDLLASVTADGLRRPVDVTLAYAVRNWLLTEQSRATAAIMAGRRWVRRDGEVELMTGEPRYGSFAYPEPLGVQPVMEDYPLPEALTVPRHLDARTVRLVMTASTLREVFGPDAPSPARVSDQERADSWFTVMAVVSDGEVDRRTVATGRDIYGITAPIIVDATRALLSTRQSGVLAVSQVAPPTDLIARLQRRTG